MLEITDKRVVSFNSLKTELHLKVLKFRFIPHSKHTSYYKGKPINISEINVSLKS